MNARYIRYLGYQEDYITRCWLGSHTNRHISVKHTDNQHTRHQTACRTHQHEHTYQWDSPVMNARYIRYLGYQEDYAWHLHHRCLYTYGAAYCSTTLQQKFIRSLEPYYAISLYIERFAPATSRSRPKVNTHTSWHPSQHVNILVNIPVSMLTS